MHAGESAGSGSERGHVGILSPLGLRILEGSLKGNQFAPVLRPRIALRESGLRTGRKGRISSLCLSVARPLVKPEVPLRAA